MSLLRCPNLGWLVPSSNSHMNTRVAVRGAEHRDFRLPAQPATVSDELWSSVRFCG